MVEMINFIYVHFTTIKKILLSVVASDEVHIH